MKISKVNHTSTGVGVANRESEGMLYNNPSKAGKDAKFSGDELEKRIADLNNRAKKLYNVFNEIKENVDKNEKKEWIRINEAFKVFTVSLTKKNRKDQLRFVRNFQNEDVLVKDKNGSVTKKGRNLSVVNRIEKKAQSNNSPQIGMAALMAKAGFAVNDDLYVSELEDFVRKYVGKSIRRAYDTVTTVNGKKVDVKEVVISLAIAIADQNAFDSKMKDLSDDELNAFLNILDKDYNKKEQLELIIKSLKNQDTKVQVKEKNGETLLAPAFSYNEKKKALFDFMIEYSSKDDVGRAKLREQKKDFINRYLVSGNSDGTVFSEKLENALRKVANESDKVLKKELKKEAEEILRNELVAKYKDMCDFVDDDDEQGKYWLIFFANETEKWVRSEIKKNNGLSRTTEKRRLAIKDISEHLFKYFLSFMASKFIDVGKGVYHFTSCDNKNVGELLPEFADGISSFDYERIAAEERVKRDMSTSIAFAVNNFANSVCDSKELAKIDDALSKDPKENPECFRKNAKKKVLRFFGGESNWSSLVNTDNIDFVYSFRENLAAVRNSTVHFDAEFSEGRTEKTQEIIKNMFNEEYDKLGTIYAKKYYSNNVPLFYKVEDIVSLVGKTLYREERPVVAAVPSFSKVIAASKVGEFAKEWIGPDKIYKINKFNIEFFKKFEASLYFVLKEIYYYGFLADKDLMTFFDKALAKIEPQDATRREFRNEKKAYDNFKERYVEIKNSGKVSASDICERIMIDYSLQNNDIKVVLTSKNDKDKDKEIYQHFKMLLYKLLKVAFTDYLNSVSGYAFLKNPENREEVVNRLSEEEFSSKFKINAYESVKSAADNTELLAWYATAHFLSKKQINLLCGSIRTEIKYLKDIDKRAASTGNAVGQDTDEKLAFYIKLLRMLEFTMNFCDVISNNVTDYFDDEEDYAKRIAVFVDYPKSNFAKDSLAGFCNREVEGSRSGRVGIFYDAENPIVNKNVVRADMYGCDKLFESGIIGKVSFDDIKEYYGMLPKTDNIFLNNGERTADEQKLIRKFQNLKNRIELTDVVSYSEVLNELYGQLLSWAYLRERDLIYMQLGYYYIKLFWGDSVSPEDPLNKYTEGEKFAFDKGAVLYFIKAMYSHDLKKPEALKTKKLAIMAFAEYYGEKTYNAGLELFERDDIAHEEAIALRNYIAHFKYFSRLDRSMEEIYGDVFSEFFAYNPNYHKSIPVVYKNILAQFKLIANIEVAESDSKPYSGKTVREYKNAKWVIKRDFERIIGYKTITEKGLESDILTFKIKPFVNNKGKKITELTLPAHDDLFLSNIRRIISYKA